MDHYQLEPHLKEKISSFENFLYQIGFKRIEGAVFGLLTLAEQPLTAEEIEKNLSLSQSSVSNALKKLSFFGAIETRESREKRAQLHTVKEDSLSIAATVFKRREQEAIEEFKKEVEFMIKDLGHEQSVRVNRLRSIVATSEIAEAVMNFVIKLSKSHTSPYYDEIVHFLPKALDFVANTPEKIKGDISLIRESVTKGLVDKIIQLRGSRDA